MSATSRKTMIFATFLALPISGARAAWTETVLHSFDGASGAGPSGSLIFDEAGNLYGTTRTGGASGVGVIFALSPPIGGETSWTETILHSFSGLDGAGSTARLTFDQTGNLYGTTLNGGPAHNGVAFELSPPSAGGSPWTESVIHSFHQRALGPQAGVIFDSSGNLYGTTLYGGISDVGAVFELSPPAIGENVWTKRNITSFDGANGSAPFANLIFDAEGNLYGTTNTGGASNVGSVFELSPPIGGGSTWTETILFSFGGVSGAGPTASLVFDAAGNLYGTAGSGGKFNKGTVFKLSPPGAGKSSWVETVLHSFKGADGDDPFGGLIFDGAGNLYGTTVYGGSSSEGAVFELSPPAAGKTAWTEKVLHSFDGVDGSNPYCSVIFDAAGNLYGNTYSGGQSNSGTIFELTP